MPDNETAKKIGTIVLDPGHGGTAKLGGSSANNATSISGVTEKALALDFCKVLRDELVRQAKQANESVDVFLTREKDVNVGIAKRAAMAFDKKANLFLSLHFNGFTVPGARGPETFFAAASNGNPNEKDDKAFATRIHKALLEGLKAVDPTVAAKDRGVKPDTQTGPKKLGTLNDVSLGNNKRQDKCLAAYFEVEFITNPTVEKVLVSGPQATANRKTVMGSVAKAMLEQLRAMP